MKKAMFSKFTSILQHAVDALAPQLSMQEEFVLHWKAVTGFFIDNKGEKMPVEQTTIPSHLEQMLVILQQEDQEVEGGMYGPCLEYLLQHKLLETLYSLGRTDYPPGMKQMVLSFFTKLLSRVKKPILAHVNVYRAVQRMIKTCGEVKAAPTEIEEIQFLCTVCAKIKGDPYLVNFFLEMPKPSQSVNSGPGGPVKEEPVSENKLVQEFHLVTTLLNLSHSEDSRVAVKACEGLILCSSLPEPIAAHCMINSTNFCDDLTQRLVDTYVKLPETINPVDLEFVQAKWGMDVITEREDKQTFTGKRHLVSFLSWLDFCDQLSTIANPIVAEALARTIHQKFLLPYFKPALLQMSESGAITSVAYLTRCFRTVCSQRLLSEFALFVIGEDRRPEIRDADQTSLRSRFIENCNNVSEEMCLVSLQLFDTLLQKDDEHILYNLVIRNLERRHYCKAKGDISDKRQFTQHMIGEEALSEFENIAKSQNNSQIEIQAEIQGGKGIQSEAKSQMELDSQGVRKSVSEARSQDEEEMKNHAKSQLEAQSEIEVEAQNEAKPENETESQTKIEEHSEAKSKNEAGSQSEAKSQNEAASQREAKSQTEARSQSEVNFQNEAEFRNEAGPQSEANCQNEAGSQSEAKSQNEAEAQSRAEAQNEAGCQPGALKEIADTCDKGGEFQLQNGGTEEEGLRQTMENANTNCLPVQSECHDNKLLPTSMPETVKCKNPNFSPVYSKTEVHKIVNSFLSLLPEELKSSYQTADSGYDMYLRDAHRQYTSMLEATKNWGYPTKCGPLPTETEEFYEGSFLHMLLDKLTHILDQSYPVNLQLTSVISKLALVPHPYLHEFLLDPFLPVKPGVRTLYSIFQKVANEIKAKFEAEPDLSHKLILVRKKLMGNSTTGQRSDGQNELEAIIVLEEFCKELSAIAFVKHHAAVTGDRS